MTTEERTDGGDGVPDCPVCNGRGAIDVDIPEPKEGEIRLLQIPRVRPCQCVYAKRLVLNLNRGWKAAVKAPKIKSSPLLKLTDKDVWITASPVTMQAHVKHVAFRQNPDWDFIVTSDSELVVAWLGNMILKRADIHDQEVAKKVGQQSLEHHSLADLAVPPELLIIQLGVKAAANRETPTVLEEAIRSRHSEGKPTWVFDQPNRPYMPGHMAYSDQLEEFLDVHFERTTLTSLGRSARARQAAAAKAATTSPQQKVAGNVPAPSFSLSDLSGADQKRQTTELRKPRRRKTKKKK